MIKRLFIGLSAVAVFAVAALAQDAAAPPANPISASERGIYQIISGYVVAAAQKMPAENYSFKPTPDIRSFGQLVGHVADSEYGFCAEASGESIPVTGIEKSKVTKDDLVTALKGAVAYCSKAYAAMTDAEGAKMTKMMNFNVAKLSILSLNIAHTDEHYGNMVTYMRLKGIVPPSSEKRTDATQ